MPYVLNTPDQQQEMLSKIGVSDVAELLEQIPRACQLARPLNMPPALTELELEQEMRSLAGQNIGPSRRVCFLGGGAYEHFIPAVVDEITGRGEFYTAYTPYQAEASQGSLQAFFEYQSLVCALTGMDASNASLYEGGSAVCEAVLMAMHSTNRKRVVLAEGVHPEYRQVVETYLTTLGGEVVNIDLDKPMAEILATLSKYPIKTRVSMTGTMVVARDSAHSKLRERLEKGEPLPDYFKNHPVYYAGPAKTPEGYASGAFGPTTAGRMDSFVEQFQAAGGSLVMVAKGNRAPAVREACKKHGGFYLGSIGGSAANLAEHCIKKVEVVEYPELGMEAIWRIEVVDFPAFIIVDDKGNDFFRELNLG